MRLSYKTRQFYRRLFRILLALVIAALLLLLCWVLWLRRFIVYTADGVVLDFSLSQQWPQGQVSQQRPSPSMPDIYFTQPEPTRPPVEEETNQFEAYYVSLDELQYELDEVLTKILNLPEGTPVMLDVKGYWGSFYYSSALGAASGSFDMATMDAFFAAVNQSGAYAIARLPAFRDYAFADKNNNCGLKESRGYLWVDSDRCYWLDPGNDAVLTYLVNISKELHSLGFDEVAFYHFSFPDTNQIAYDADREETIQKAAATLVNACAKDDLVISFITTDPTFPLPEGNCRLYLQDVAAADVQTVLMLMESGVMERTVFFTQSNDTRYEVCGVIRPLDMAE